jgi:hypothetical protein
MNFKNTIFLAGALCLFCLSDVTAQVDIFSKNALDKIKDGTTHVIVNDLDFPNSAEYYRVFKKYWTVTKGVEFLKASDIKDNLKEGDSYFSIESTIWYSGDVHTSYTYYYLNLWVPNDRAINKPAKYNIHDEVAIAHLNILFRLLPGDRPKPSLDFDGSGHISNWHPGTVKNYLQQLQIALLTGKKMQSENVEDKEQIKQLRGHILYCPEDDFFTWNIFGKLGKYTDEQITDLYKEYEFQYKTITNRELEDKILADKEPFYYMIYVPSVQTGKMVGVVNSRTGELIYSKAHSSMSYSLKSGDIKELNKAVNKE